mmetsp:Transcript_47747/g.139222  ORF Transcript_47747/g.139222 Transcript_47747/m.139222 type:complete len:108 (-) Transcript_47747:308-631(-)|eukprot:CAMPEP_0170269564 /NCGR_PEP_ID=MMETSP0116_2-20130129/34722_1 /TAXON_ID=400756 /ORGANISM="Durinskia baltica, Strain CSIRO CS-38" /LENGTH=107 /DNA_ID=CAMNT_0010520747 /DNA_START=54 /DNA_END=377 /DNA_ORIENTATION=-
MEALGAIRTSDVSTKNALQLMPAGMAAKWHQLGNNTPGLLLAMPPSQVLFDALALEVGSARRGTRHGARGGVPRRRVEKPIATAALDFADGSRSTLKVDLCENMANM